MSIDLGWFDRLFVNEAKKALDARKLFGTGSGESDDDTNAYILIDESGNNIPAVLVSEEQVFTATANDIREGSVAATEAGVTVGTKEIPSYIVSEGVVVILPGEKFLIPLPGDKCNYTELQAILCKFNTSVTNSVESDMVSIKSNVYAMNSGDSISTVTSDESNGLIDLGITNDSNNIYVVRYFSYKEEY